MNLKQRHIYNTNSISGPLRMTLVDVSGESKTRYTPLALMYLAEAVAADPDLSEAVQTKILPFMQSDPHVLRIEQIVEQKPHVLGFSCQGWNMVQIGLLLPTLRALLPETIFLVGGNHVTDRGESVLRKFPELDVVVNGEGERTLVEFLKSVTQLQPRKWKEIQGLTFWTEEGIFNCEPRPRVRDLEQIWSPYLEPRIDISKFDIALLETNRGCPYHCGFCFWGGAVGQKMAMGTPNRVRLELQSIGKAKIPTVFLCDANFGILPQDLEIAKLVVETYRTYGAPEAFHVNWAKSHAARIETIIRILAEGGIRSSVYIALQTLSPRALALADRTEKGRAETIALAHKLVAEGIPVGCELIFGMPGESLAEFRGHYDELVLQFPTLMVHPLWLLPSTSYDRRRKDLGIVSTQSDPATDYQGILQHNELPMRDTREGLALLLADEILLRARTAAVSFRAFVKILQLSATDILVKLERLIRSQSDPLRRALTVEFDLLRQQTFFSREIKGRVRLALLSQRELLEPLLQTLLSPQESSPALSDLIRQLIRYDISLLPRFDLDSDHPGGFADTVLNFSFDPELVRDLILRGAPRAAVLKAMEDTAPQQFTVRHRAGFRTKMAGEPNDVSNLWHGQVVARNAAS